jgi:GNAT superfamily N-acetyltransferase
MIVPIRWPNRPGIGDMTVYTDAAARRMQPMPDFDIILTEAPADSDAAMIERGLAEFDAEQVGIRDRRRLAVLMRDAATGQTLGGVLGRTSLGMLFVDLVYLPKTLRGRGLGSRMMGMAEQEAARRGCRSGALITTSFQAPGFYARHGWHELARVPCDPPGTFRELMSKTLASPVDA